MRPDLAKAIRIASDLAAILGVMGVLGVAGFLLYVGSAAAGFWGRFTRS